MLQRAAPGGAGSGRAIRPAIRDASDPLMRRMIRAAGPAALLIAAIVSPWNIWVFYLRGGHDDHFGIYGICDIFCARLKRIIVLFMAVQLVQAVACCGEATSSPWNHSTTDRPTTIAVIASPQLQNAGWVDLIISELSRHPELRLVEREKLATAVAELQLSQLLGPDSPEQRLKLGHLVAADLLLILTPDSATDTPSHSITIIISDCVTGARLQLAHARLNSNDNPEALASAIADTVLATRSRFPEGVKWVTAIPPFVNQALTHDNDSLGVEYADLLANAIAAVPGAAVLEVDEARQIADERSISGSPGTRGAAIMIRGQYEVKQDKVTFDINIDDAAAHRDLRRSLSMSQAAVYITQDVARGITGQIAHLTPLDLEAQFNLLAGRADLFAGIGDFENAASIREAALLLRPSDIGQHLQLSREYQWLSLGIEKPALKSAADRDDFQRRSDDRWRRGLAHLEYLIRNDSIRRPEAIELSRSYRSRCGFLIPYQPAELRDFLSAVFPRVLTLASGTSHDYPRPMKPEEIEDLELRNWTSVFFETAADEAPLVADSSDTERELRWLEQRIRQDFPDSCASPLVGRAFLKIARIPSPEAQPFLDRVASDGKLGYACWARLARLETTPAVRSSELNALRSAYQALNFHGRSPAADDPFFLELDRFARRGNGAPELANQPDPPSGRTLWYVPVPVGVRMLDGRILASPPLDTPPQSQHAFSAGKDLDLIWSSNRIFSWRAGSEIRECFNAKRALSAAGIKTWGKLSITDVKWDGSRIWAACLIDGIRTAQSSDQTSGIAVMDADGTRIDWIAQPDGLPPCDDTLLLDPISEGRVIATGAFGAHPRGWCALVESAKPAHPARINVFLSAREQDPHAGGSDIHTGFRPIFLGDVPSRHLVLLARRSATPILIDPQSLGVRAMTVPDQAANPLPNGNCIIAGNDLLLYTSDALLRLAVPPDAQAASSLTRIVETRRDTTYANNIIPAGDCIWFYHAAGASDSSWLRYDLAFPRVETVLPDDRFWRTGPCRAYGYTGQYGLIGWGDRVCRIVMSRDRPADALVFSPSSAAHVTTAAGAGPRRAE